MSYYRKFNLIRMSALSQSVSTCFQYSWSTQHSSIVTVLLNLNKKFIKDATAWGTAMCVLVYSKGIATGLLCCCHCNMRDIKPPNIITGILNHLWNICRLADPCKPLSLLSSPTPFPCPIPPLPHHNWSWKISFLCLLEPCYVSCEKS